MLKSTISRNISLLMEYHDIRSETKLAEAANISQTTLNKLVSGTTSDPRISTLKPIAKFFNITLDSLMSENPIFADELQHKKVENPAGATQLIPLVSESELLDIYETLSSLTQDNWPSFPIPKQNTSNYYAMLTTKKLDKPFEKARVLIIKNEDKLPDDSYCLLKHIDSDSVSIKKIKVVDGKKWLFALQNVPSLEFDEAKWQPLGTIEAAFLDMSSDTFFQAGDKK